MRKQRQIPRNIDDNLLQYIIFWNSFRFTTKSSTEISHILCSHICIVSPIINMTHQRNTIFYKNQTKDYIVYLRAYSWCCTFLGLDKYKFIIIICRIFPLPYRSSSLYLFISPSDPRYPLIFSLTLYFCLFQNAMQLKAYTLQSFQISFFYLLATCIEGFSMFFMAKQLVSLSVE